MRSREILISVPTRGDVTVILANRLQEVREQDRNIPPIYFEEGHLSVAETRNKIVEYFMGGEWKALVMIDSDVCPNPEFLKITDHLTTYGMVGCPVPIFGLARGLFFAVYSEKNEPILPQRASVGVMTVGSIGTGCVAIAREVFEKLGSRPFDLGYAEDGTFESDDVRFCQKVRKAGFKIGCHWDQPADHWQRFHAIALMLGR
jgi:hypothetical protein